MNHKDVSIGRNVPASSGLPSSQRKRRSEMEAGDGRLGFDATSECGFLSSANAIQICDFLMSKPIWGGWLQSRRSRYEAWNNDWSGAALIASMLEPEAVGRTRLLHCL